MSDAESGYCEWRFYVQDMIKFCQEALSYTEGLGQSTFVDDCSRQRIPAGDRG